MEITDYRNLSHRSMIDYRFILIYFIFVTFNVSFLMFQYRLFNVLQYS